MKGNSNDRKYFFVFYFFFFFLIKFFLGTSEKNMIINTRDKRELDIFLGKYTIRNKVLGESNKFNLKLKTFFFYKK